MQSRIPTTTVDSKTKRVTGSPNLGTAGKKLPSEQQLPSKQIPLLPAGRSVFDGGSAIDARNYIINLGFAIVHLGKSEIFRRSSPTSDCTKSSKVQQNGQTAVDRTLQTTQDAQNPPNNTNNKKKQPMENVWQ
ncbi:hypothetical protein TNIN_305091 [Trichonephila inaurata madagascariensis]|uniref:Uncharacterized protein n=1 Tax=Trichonephila inaurata madagascariensis TaxID=2747483 RepID=A0A8X7BV05_9ARAC|nr:hypothetical protein TNIN_305091 [Trichonephila inaurata madagascariensis]